MWILSLNPFANDCLLVFLKFIQWLSLWNIHLFSSLSKRSTIQSKNTYSVQFSSVQSFSRVQLFATPMNRSMPGLPVHHQLPEFTQTLVHWVGDAIQPSHPLSSPSPPTFNLSQHQGLFKWVSSAHQVTKVLEFQLQHQSFQWIFRVDFLWVIASCRSERRGLARSL